MKVKDLKGILKTQINEIFLYDSDFATGMHIITTFSSFDQLTNLLLESEVAGIYPQSKTECHIEII